MTTIKSLLSAALDSYLKSENKWVGKHGFAHKDIITIIPFPGTTGMEVSYAF